jgi:hypothetical protein
VGTLNLPLYGVHVLASTTTWTSTMEPPGFGRADEPCDDIHATIDVGL